MTSTPLNSNEDLAALSYERARDELVEVVRRLESGTASLAESMELWQRGEKLTNHCQRLLEAARATVAQATGARPVATEARSAAGDEPTEDGADSSGDDFL